MPVFWAKVIIPVVMAAAGGGAMVLAARDAPAGALDSAPAQVWIDGPTGDRAFPLGDLTVTAHATDTSIDALILEVDGKDVATDDQLDRSGKLALAHFAWSAKPGLHQLVAKSRGTSNIASAMREIEISADAPAVPTSAVTSTTVAQNASTTSDPSDTTVGGSASTSSGVPITDPATGSVVAPPETQPTGIDPSPTGAPPVTGPAATPPPQTQPPATQPPANQPPETQPPETQPPETQPPETQPPPVVDGASVSGTVYEYSFCPYSATVSVRARNATGAQVSVAGTSFSAPMSGGGPSFSAQIPSGFTAAEVGTHPVVVQVSGPGGTVEQTVDNLVVNGGCPKD